MTVPRWLDRSYTVAVAIAALIGIPLFVYDWGQRFGWTNTGLFVAALFLAGLWRGWPTYFVSPSGAT